MKKLLGIVVTVLFWCNASYAELITLTNCYIVKYDDTDGENFSYRNFDEQNNISKYLRKRFDHVCGRAHEFPRDARLTLATLFMF